MTLEALEEGPGQLCAAVRPPGPGSSALSPADRVPDDLRPEVVAHQSELAALLAVRATDPRPDPMAGDSRPYLPGSEVWARLLEAARAQDGQDPRGFFGGLRGVRCWGTVLEWHGGRWRLAPRIDLTERQSIWHDRASWDANCDAWLRPLLPPLQELLWGLETT